MLSSIKPAMGRLLLSEPFMVDPNFKRSVVYLTEHNQHCSLGFVLNHKTDLVLSDLLDNIKGTDYPIYIGGPTGNDSLHFIHVLGNKIEGSIQVQEGVWWGGDFETLRKLINKKVVHHNEVKFFIGYSGWDHGQLTEELNENTWLIAESKTEFLFGESNKKLWVDVVKTMGKEYAPMVHFPEHPSLN